jgi:prepilin-type N-terminal cleavage/methylation domain-containing protein
VLIKIVKGFTLIELLVVMAIISILSGVGVVAYNGYTSAAKETATKANHKKIVNNMESEFAKCKLDRDSKIFNSYNCNSANDPSTGTINNYVNSLGLKNPYDKTQNVAQSNVCTSGSIAITEKETGSYNVAYASVKKKKKHTSLVSSGWSENYSKTKTTSVAYTCASASAAKSSIDTYKVPDGVPYDGFGAYIAVDKNGKMIKKSYSGCTYSYCGNEAEKNRTGGYGNLYNRAEGRWYKPGEVKFVLIQANRGTEPPGTVMNSAVPFNSNGGRICTNGDCTYNFADNTFTDNQTGQVFEAGSGKRIK